MMNLVNNSDGRIGSQEEDYEKYEISSFSKNIFKSQQNRQKLCLQTGIRKQKIIQPILVYLVILIQISVVCLQSPPIITKQPPTDEILFQVAQSQDENTKPFIIECVAEGEPAPKYRWVKNGKEFKWYDYDFRISQQPQSGTLVIIAPRPEDAGQYGCYATNEFGTATSNQVFVRQAELNSFKEKDPKTIVAEDAKVPYFTIEPEIKTVTKGETVEFQCEATGKPVPEIKWIHNGKALEEAEPNPRRKLIGNKIVIENVKKSDTGNYGCNATNSFGYVYKDVYVNVLAIPADIREKLKNVVTTFGKSVTLTCRVFGFPRPLVRWFRNNQELSGGGRFKVLDNGNLEIRDVRFTDGGEYICDARNKYGNDSASGTLVVESELPGYHSLVELGMVLLGFH